MTIPPEKVYTHWLPFDQSLLPKMPDPREVATDKFKFTVTDGEKTWNCLAVKVIINGAPVTWQVTRCESV